MTKKAKNKETTRKKVGTRMMFRNLPFIYFLSGLALLYIANAHYAERKVRQIDALKKEIEQMRWEFNSVKSDFLFKSTQSQLTKDVSTLKYADDPLPPKRIEIDEN